MDYDKHPVDLEDDQLLKNCSLQRLRRSGPGGQHRNKVETAVCITHVASGIKAEANERRSQSLNKTEAIKRIKVKLACFIRINRTENESPSSLWIKHCRNGKISVSLKNSDHPSLLAEALDQIYQESLDLKSASMTLNCTMSQLVKFIKQTPVAWTLLNSARKEKGLHTYR